VHADHDAGDRRIIRRLGYAMVRAQLFEIAIVKVIEAQRHDLTTPVDDRWSEIEGWLELPAGRAAKRLQLHEEITADLKELVVRRNVVAHKGWVAYVGQREKYGDGAIQVYVAWFDQQIEMLGNAYNALMEIVVVVRDRPDLSRDEMLEMWRRTFPTPLWPVEIPWMHPEA
jgi:hypothetical protein